MVEGGGRFERGPGSDPSWYEHMDLESRPEMEPTVERAPIDGCEANVTENVSRLTRDEKGKIISPPGIVEISIDCEGCDLQRNIVGKGYESVGEGVNRVVAQELARYFLSTRCKKWQAEHKGAMPRESMPPQLR